jgi:hypothetical protein
MDWKSASVDWKPLEPGGRWVEVIARIHDNQTGEVREFATHEALNPGEERPNDCGWSGGNYSCDCNRALFFARAKGEPDPDFECGESRYTVQLLNPVDGAIYYDEIADPDARG